jgi:2'-5' RNA ligase
VCVPEAEPLVAPFRKVHDPEAVARGIPPHVTLLFPFVPLGEADPTCAGLARHAASLPAFAATLDAVGAFDGHVWLRPAPAGSWRGLIDATVRRFPGTPPYGGAFPAEEIVPHLTVGVVGDAGIDEVFAAAVRELEPQLPLPFHVDRLTLLAEDDVGSWSTHSEYRLG